MENGKNVDDNYIRFLMVKAPQGLVKVIVFVGQSVNYEIVDYGPTCSID